MGFTRVLCTLPFKAFECRKTRKTSNIASRAGKMQLFEGKYAQHKTHPKPLFTVNYSVFCTFKHAKKKPPRSANRESLTLTLTLSLTLTHSHSLILWVSETGKVGFCE